MKGTGGDTGEGSLLFVETTAFTGLCGLGGTTGGGISLIWGLLTLMLRVVLALVVMVG